MALDLFVDGVSQSDAEDLAQTVHAEVCPYSKAVRGKVDVDIRVRPVAAATA